MFAPYFETGRYRESSFKQNRGKLLLAEMDTFFPLAYDSEFKDQIKVLPRIPSLAGYLAVSDEFSQCF